MNQRNVDALYEAIEAVGEEVEKLVRRKMSMTHQDVSRLVAERLASYGVLAPLSLTAKDVDLLRNSVDAHYTDEHALAASAGCPHLHCLRCR